MKRQLLDSKKAAAALSNFIKANKSKEALDLFKLKSFSFSYKDSSTILELSCTQKMPEVALQLIEKGERWDIPYKDGIKLLHLTSSNGLLEVTLQPMAST